MDVRPVPLAEVRRTNGRAMKPGAVKQLADSMAALGLLSPIMVAKKVRNDGPAQVDSFWIIAGQHRAEAARSLGWAEIDAIVVELDAPHAELCEIDENLIRAELSTAQRALHHKRRKEIMTDLGLVSAPGKGGDRKSNAESALDSYAAQAAEQLGVGRRTVETDIARADAVVPEVMEAIAGTDLDTGANLDALRKTPAAEQPAKLAAMKARAEAPKPPRRTAPTPINLQDRRVRPLVAQWNQLSVEDQDAFLAIVGAARVKQEAA